MFRLLKLKPPSGWAAVAWELAIVTLGVLFALGAEQLIQNAHQRREARDADLAIRGELEQNMAKLRTRWEMRQCVQSRLDELQALIESGAAGAAIQTPSWVGRPPFWTMQMARWQASSQAGRAANLPAVDLALYGSMYSYMANVSAAMVEEQDLWARLRSLERSAASRPKRHSSSPRRRTRRAISTGGWGSGRRSCSPCRIAFGSGPSRTTFRPRARRACRSTPRGKRH